MIEMRGCCGVKAKPEESQMWNGKTQSILGKALEGTEDEAHNLAHTVSVLYVLHASKLQ